MTQAEAVPLAIAGLSLALSLWTMWVQRRMAAEMEAAWADIDAHAAELRERR